MSSNTVTHSSSMPRITIKDIIQNFAPGWFASVMGTGMLAVLMLAFSKAVSSPVLMYLAWGFFWVNIAFVILFSIPWLLRWILYWDSAYKSFTHPVQTNFYPTFSIGLLIVAVQLHAFDFPSSLAKAAWWVAAVLTYVFNVLIMVNIFSKDEVKDIHITAANYIPAVGLVVIPISGIPVLEHMSGLEGDFALMLNILSMGAGCIMYIAVLTLSFSRHFFQQPAFGILTPTVWVQMAPLGVIPVSLMNIFGYLHMESAFEMTKALGMLFYGSGIWWLIMAITLTCIAIKRRAFPFALSWWAFIFPLGALTNLSLRLAHYTYFKAFFILGVAIFTLMVFLWCITFIRTFIGVINGSLFKAH